MDVSAAGLDPDIFVGSGFQFFLKAVPDPDLGFDEKIFDFYSISI